MLPFLALALFVLPAQEEAVAITGVRILPVSKAEIPSGTILIKGGKIVAVGKDVKIPENARRIDGKGLVAAPGMIHPDSRIGASRSLPRSTAPSPHVAAVDELNAALDVYGPLARCGITAYGFSPAGGAIAGRGAVVKPVEGSKARKVMSERAFLRLNMRADTGTKDALRKALEAAKKAVEEERKAEAAKKKAAAAKKKTPGKKAPEKKKEAEGNKSAAAPAKPTPAASRPAKKPSAKLRVLMDFLKGELPALVSVSSASDLLHYWQIMEGFSEFKPKVTFLAPAEAYKAASKLGTRKARVILRPGLTYLPMTRTRVNTAAEVSRAGAVVALAPNSDRNDALEGYRFRVAELVKYGLGRNAALRALTLVPAEALGVSKRIGSIEAGKDADLVLFDGDPLDPSSRIRTVLVNGRTVYTEE